MPDILIADSLSQEGQDVFAQAEGFHVDYRPDITPDELKSVIGNYDGLVIRSRAEVRAETLENPGRLKVIGRAGVGLDNVDIAKATEKGVIVMNVPGGNTVSTAENAMSLLLSLARNVATAHASMKAGRWDKKKLQGVELLNKTIGVVGLGRIGLEVAKRAKGFDMRVIAFDPYASKQTVSRLGIELVELEEIWKRADFITVHTPLNDETRGLIDAEAIARMKPTCRIINCARGGIVDETALVEALKEGRIAGAALDVYETEPLPEDHPLRSLDNVILTPHLSASTAEAQEKVAVAIAEQIVEVLNGKPPRNAVNAPSTDPETLESIRPYLGLAEKLGMFAAQYMSGAIERFGVTYSGAVLDCPTDPITTAAAIGYLACQSETAEINYVNANYLMKERGVEIIEKRSSELYGYANLVTIEAEGAGGAKIAVSGTLFTREQPRIVILDDKHVDARPNGTVIVLHNRDVPGVIGAIGTLLGNHNVNIAQMSWGRSKPGGDAVTVINCDSDVPKAVLEQIVKQPNVEGVRLIRL